MILTAKDCLKPRTANRHFGASAISAVKDGGLPVPNLDVTLTAAEAALVIPSVSRHLVYMWRATGKVTPAGMRGRSPVYRYGDLLNVERSTRNADPAHQRQTTLTG